MNKKTLAIVITINVILIGSIITLYFMVWKPSRVGEQGFLTITGANIEEIKLSIKELEALPNITKNYVLQGNPTFSANYTGVSVYYLVTVIANVSENVEVKVIASDNYFNILTLDELNQTKEIIIAYKKNDDYIKSGNQGGEGPLRLIIPQRFPEDYNAQFCVKYVVSLELIPINTSNSS